MEIKRLIFSEDICELNELRDITIKTFAETFEALNTPENFKKYIDENFNLRRLEDDIKNKNSFTFLVKIENEIVGYLKLNAESAQTEEMGKDYLEIERIYVLKKHQGKLLGNALVKMAIDKAKEFKKKFIWLGVWEKNERAINFYLKKNFVQFDTHIFKLGNDEQNDYLFRLEME